ncbi:UDP-N-acetylglucosamine 2-epimerase [Pseudodesulfovibrio nedwellii]|nr:UDP-N-acetylglucosamine 2-epimerase [Pseudodesulfovibrio nedwellii]
MRKICFYTANRSEYSRLRSVMESVHAHEDLSLMVVAGGSHLLERYGMTISEIENDGFPIVDRLQTVVEGTSLESMAKSAGLAIIELTTSLTRITPDVLVVIGDRYDMLPAVIAASYLNIPIAHIQGGEKTGTIDESIRHAVTKLSHIHFPATESSREFIIQMGEDPERVFLSGCPSIDILLRTPEIGKKALFDSFPIPSITAAFSPDAEQDYLLYIQHPVTTEYGKSYEQMEQSLEALRRTGMQVFLIYPNLDAGSNDMIKALHRFTLRHDTEDWLFCYKHIPMNIFSNLMRYATCMVGNSSAGIRESCYFGLPTVNIGSRQKNRTHGQNVTNVEHDTEEILQAIQTQIAHGKYPVEQIYGTGNAGEEIANILAQVTVEVQK